MRPCARPAARASSPRRRRRPARGSRVGDLSSSGSDAHLPPAGSDSFASMPTSSSAAITIASSSRARASAGCATRSTPTRQCARPSLTPIFSSSSLATFCSSCCRVSASTARAASAPCSAACSSAARFSAYSNSLDCSRSARSACATSSRSAAVSAACSLAISSTSTAVSPSWRRLRPWRHLLEEPEADAPTPELALPRWAAAQAASSCRSRLLISCNISHLSERTCLCSAISSAIWWCRSASGPAAPRDRLSRRARRSARVSGPPSSPGACAPTRACAWPRRRRAARRTAHSTAG